MRHVPVLVVGGSSVGLSAGLFLGKHEIPALIVERHAELSAHPRATAISQRSREMFREVGLEQRVLDASQSTALGGKIKVTSLAEADLASIPRARRPRAELARESDAFTPAVLGGPCPQHLLDPILREGMLARGGELRTSTELVAVEQNADAVTATLLDRTDGSRFQVTADYLVAADGASSPTRRMLGVDTHGRGGLGDHLVNILFRADLGELVRGYEFTVCEIDGPRLKGGLLPVDQGGTSWVFHTSYDPGRGESPQDFTPERCTELIRLAAGVPDLKVEVRSVLPWRMAASIAGEFRQGRCFLVGDAAHVTPPMGGFGLNTGIADAHNLAWKLALVLRGRASASLLDSYDSERRPVARFAMEQSLLRLDHPQLHWDDNAGAERASVGMVNLNVAHLGFSYVSDAIVEPRELLASTENVELCLDGAPGTRVPHAWIGVRGERSSTLDLLDSRFTVLAGPRGAAWCEAAVEAGVALGIEINAYRIGGEETSDDGDWPGRTGLKPTGAVLVRPDGYVAWRSAGGGADPRAELARVLARVLGR
ncbi:FAD-dependent monooxygenase [Streptomyces inhibens]|uniref:FAD-dependent monooxygenase n=1 Tax=Streptomyces inhibens TaxID=2293571 RepID=UPI001EE756E7|nr:FAD-dependent monooxygenase [Streptomyces inhibens]UKY51791.1 FAD-dependent monooxygenase [Streptomyces inhibens]